jgi:hypothetical protein
VDKIDKIDMINQIKVWQFKEKIDEYKEQHELSASAKIENLTSW